MTRQEAERQAQEYYKQRRLESDRELMRRERRARSEISGLDELMSKRASLPVSALRAAMANPDRAREISLEMREKGLELNRKIRETLLHAGYPENYLSPAYECAACKDTGFTETESGVKPCACFEKRVNALLSSEKNDCFTGACFEDFKSDFVPDKPLDGGVTQRMLTERIRDACIDYVKTYPDTLYRGMILSGNAGLGKTFLLSCLYNEFRKKGVGAVAISSFELMEKIRAVYFHQDDAKEAFDELESAPVLLIDDLGSEPLMRTVSLEEYLCVLLNERMNRKLHTVITTNLTPAQFKDRYSERVMSRLADKRYWDHLRLRGDDLRRA